MHRPLKDDTEMYEALLEEYCDFLEDALAKQAKRTDYWCSEANDARALYKEQVKETARVRRERAA